MKTKLLFSLILIVTFSLTGMAQKNDVNEATKTISDFKATNSKINKLFDSAYGYVVLPGIGKGGLGIGGAMGKGTVFKEKKAVADCKMSQITIGFQLGGQKYAEVIFFENADAYDQFVSSKFEFATQVAAVALDAEIAVPMDYHDGMIVFTKSLGGLMFEASVGGQKFKTEMY